MLVERCSSTCLLLYSERKQATKQAIPYHDGVRHCIETTAV